MTHTLFTVSFWFAAPFWAVMIVAPTWRRTAGLVASPLICLPPLVIYLMLMTPHVGAFFPVMTRPNLVALQALLATAPAAAAIWAHLVGFDLFLGRWLYLDSRQRGIPPILVSPILVVTIFFSAVGVVVYLVLRTAYRPGDPVVAPQPAAGLVG
ncbi:ABA4-like family protein [Nocardia sp. alder85J]|uniref:ABA4-like family protein n=1 Tax=Nocardia sp. alder85J TaxID=2862949 RepID=UPI001CD34E1C|nr:ABA4-like family protein [Nocardia sp. alder85J]MCX4094175.1 ABA4-like family protein [Nocardia sp. alder85J]